MKTKLCKLALFLCLLPSIGSAQPADNYWHDQVVAYSEKLEYAFRLRSDGAYTANNFQNNIQVIISHEGYTIWPSRIEQDRPLASFHLRGSGRRSRLNPFHFEFVSNASDGLVYHSRTMDAQYLNAEEGVRQNFIVKEKPKGKGPLMVAMSLFTTLDARLINNDKLVFIDSSTGRNMISYEQLKVWDATNRQLDASMEYDRETAQLSLIVDDKTATYPIVIDPLNKAAEWTTSADGIVPGLLSNLSLQVNTLYGYNVTGLGDINNDGFDDVAVSAPGMANVVTGSGNLLGVGAVFIYLGSAQGLALTPYKILQPTTPVAGALFGFSVAAGDFTGDGIPDIAVGAPLDRYQTTAGGLLGDVNVNVTAGKVYLYRSEDLLNPGNPTPFLQVRLQGSNFFNTGVLGLLNNISVNPLFGFSVAVTDDLNGDNKKDLVIGSPAYLGVNALSVKSGAAFVYYSDNLSTTNPVSLKLPTPSILGLLSLPVANLNGLLFGFSVDGVGDYNNDGHADIIVGAPAGIDLSSLGGIFNGQVLGGSAYIYYGKANGVNTSIGATLQASPSGLLSNAANLFGYKVKGVKDAAGAHTGNVVVGSPVSSVLSNLVGGLRVKAGTVSVFTKKSGPISSAVTPDQTLSSPRSSSVLSLLSGQSLTLSLLYGANIDNVQDVNCDGTADLIVGEPLSTGIALVGANVLGGAAYVYKGKPDGTYELAPSWSVYPEISPLLGVNATALFGYSVAGAGRVRGAGTESRVLAGGPANALDFGTGLFNLGNTLNTLSTFAFDNNGIGKAYAFDVNLCAPPPSFTTLPVTLVSFSAVAINADVQLNWRSENEIDFDRYELQSSTNGIDYLLLTTFSARNNAANEYRFTDYHPAGGTNYYRLKMIDLDGKFTYSDVRIVRFEERARSSMVAAPNPARNDVKLKLISMHRGTYQLKFFSTIGRLERSLSVTVREQEEAIHIDPSGLSSGTHFIHLFNSNGKKVDQLKLVLFMD